MSVTPTTRVMSPEEIAARSVADAPFLQLPEGSTLFSERALRLRQLAAGHAMREFLIFMADVAQAQHGLLQKHPDVALPDAAALDRAALSGQAPLHAERWARDAVWRDHLRALIQEVRPRAPQGAIDALDRLVQMPNDELERQADRLLGGVMLGLDMAAAPLIAAALQVHWTHLVLQTQQLSKATASAFGRTDDISSCPCCGSRPTASITRLASDVSGQRYLQCALCSAQWHMVRIQCTHCGSEKSVAYQALESTTGQSASATGAAAGAVQAETCDECHHYLKIVHRDKDAYVEPIADDLASLTLDLLVSEGGYQRHGVNLLLLFGDPDAPVPEPDNGGGG